MKFIKGHCYVLEYLFFDLNCMIYIDLKNSFIYLSNDKKNDFDNFKSSSFYFVNNIFLKVFTYYSVLLYSKFLTKIEYTLFQSQRTGEHIYNFFLNLNFIKSYYWKEYI